MAEEKQAKFSIFPKIRLSDKIIPVLLFEFLFIFLLKKNQSIGIKTFRYLDRQERRYGF